MLTRKYYVQSLKVRKTVKNDMHKPFDLGHALEKVYPLLQIIFEHLPYDDLKAAAMVNKTWNKYSNDELQKRKEASWISVTTTADADMLVESSSNFKYGSAVFALVFYDYHRIKSNHRICVYGERQTWTNFTDYLITEIIPKDQDFWVFTCARIYPPEIPKANYSSVFSSVVIPRIPNINLKQFIVSCDDADNIFKSISKDEHIHCMLLFTLAYPNHLLKRFTKALLRRKNSKAIAIGGGVIMNGITRFQKNRVEQVYKSNMVFCIALTEQKHKPAEFDAFSLVIPDDVDFKEELRNFKNLIILREHSFAIRICCVARNDKDAEMSLFNEIFPKIFLIGLDSEGEIGWNRFHHCEPEEDTPKAKKQKKRYCLCHQYSTVIVILTYGKKKQSTN